MEKNIIFLPGMMCDQRVFFPQIKYLTDYNIEIAEVREFDSFQSLAKINLQKTTFSSFILCGLSMGGILAMEMIKQAPDKVSAVILMDTNFMAEREEKKINRIRQLEKVRRGEFKSIIIEELKPFYFNDKPSSKTKEIKDLVYQMALDSGEKTFINQSLALKDRVSYETVLKEWKKPTLIICGEADKLCPPEYHKKMQQLISESELNIIKESGHIANLESADEVNRIIKNWLNKITLS